jgi:hypothetical protein
VPLLSLVGNDFLGGTTELWIVPALVALQHPLHEIASRHATAPYRPKADPGRVSCRDFVVSSFQLSIGL